MYKVSAQVIALFPHALAGGAALYYAWFLSQTALHTTGMQFLSPLIVILLVHLGWAALWRDLRPGFAPRLIRQAGGTALFLVAGLVLGSVFAPMPAQAANLGEVLAIASVVVVCATMIAIVVGAGVLVISSLMWIIRRVFGCGDDAPKSRLFDFGTLGICCAALGLASLEGMPRGFAFDGAGAATASYDIAVPPEAVWAAMGTATSPAFPLPGALGLLPRPVEVSQDEGVGLGANRVVRFEGREGAGHLHLQVTERTATAARFTVQADTTPYAQWIGLETLTYQVESQGEGARLSVTLTFERKLAPAWFFGPLMRGAGYLAVDVLARDTVARAHDGRL